MASTAPAYARNVDVTRSGSITRARYLLAGDGDRRRCGPTVASGSSGACRGPGGAGHEEGGKHEAGFAPRGPGRAPQDRGGGGRGPGGEPRGHGGRGPPRRGRHTEDVRSSGGADSGAVGGEKPRPYAH